VSQSCSISLRRSPFDKQTPSRAELLSLELAGRGLPQAFPIFLLSFHLKKRLAMAKRILVVEDEPGIQELLKLNLTMSGYEVCQAYDADQALAAVRLAAPDLMLIDWNMPGHPGVWLVRRLRDDPQCSAVPVIMMSARDDEHDKVQAFEYGVDDYVTKPFRTRELLARVQALIRRSSPRDQAAILEIDGLCLDHDARRVSIGGEDICVGPTEYRLLHFLVSNSHRVHTRGQLLNHVWGNTAELQERTVDVYVGRLRNTFESHGHHDCIETVRSVGYRFIRRALADPVDLLGESQIAAVPTWTT
jgi:two-component system phosphate regulon response regulator PhoB